MKLRNIRPQAFSHMAMDFIKAIAVIIVRPCMAVMTDRNVFPRHPVVALVFIGVEDGLAPRKGSACVGKVTPLVSATTRNHT